MEPRPSYADLERAFENGVKRGRGEERARIVAELREMAAEYDKNAHPWSAQSFRRSANFIERGHPRAGEGDG